MACRHAASIARPFDSALRPICWHRKPAAWLIRVKVSNIGDLLHEREKGREERRAGGRERMVG